MIKLILNLLFFLILINLNSYSQTKFEREYRIKPKNVPQKAISYIDSLKLENKIKWYKEDNSDYFTYEAKFYYNKLKYSIEFDSTGSIEDIEIEVDYKSISEEIRLKICSQLDSVYSKIKIIKTQLQFTTNAKNLSLIINNGVNHLSNKKYELVIKGKINDKSYIYELQFTETGALESKAKILLKNSDHLEF